METVESGFEVFAVFVFEGFVLLLELIEFVFDEVFLFFDNFDKVDE